jgi:predicted membrane-bound spermidine synthase
MDQGHSFTRCLQDVKIKDQDSVLTRYQKYGPRPFVYKMSSRRQNKRPRQCVDKVSKVWTKALLHSKYSNFSWINKLFITPSRLVLLTGAALIGTCGFLAGIVGILHWREKVR